MFQIASKACPSLKSSDTHIICIRGKDWGHHCGQTNVLCANAWGLWCGGDTCTMSMCRFWMACKVLCACGLYGYIFCVHVFCAVVIVCLYVLTFVLYIWYMICTLGCIVCTRTLCVLEYGQVRYVYMRGWACMGDFDLGIMECTFGRYMLWWYSSMCINSAYLSHNKSVIIKLEKGHETLNEAQM